MLFLSTTAFAWNNFSYTLEVEPNQVKVIEFLFESEWTNIWVNGSSENGNIDCQLYNSDRDIMIFDEGFNDNCYFSWRPIEYEMYYLVLFNNGEELNKYNITVK
jgi:hypothetical protein